MVTLDRPPTWSTSPLTWLRIGPIPMTTTTLFFARFYSSRKFYIHLYSEEQISLLIKILSFCGASSTIIFHQQIHDHVTFFWHVFPTTVLVMKNWLLERTCPSFFLLNIFAVVLTQLDLCVMMIYWLVLIYCITFGTLEIFLIYWLHLLIYSSYLHFL